MVDSAGTNTGRLSGTMTYGPGEVGSGFVFTGYNGNGINVGNSSSLQLQTLTIEAWVKRSSASTTTYDSLYHSAMIFGFGSGGYCLAFDGTGHLIYGRTDYGGVVTSAAISDTAWHHVAVSQQGSRVVFYIDGVALAPYTYSTTYTFGASAGIGCRPDILANVFLGTIDEVSVYNRALAAAEISAIYSSGSYGKCLPTAPSVTAQPLAATNAAGTTATFSVTAAGSSPLAYQWTKDGFIISGATNSVLTLPQVSISDIGNYSVSVTNAYGAVISSSAHLSVFVPINSNGLPAPSGLLGWWRGEGTMKDEISGKDGSLSGTMSYGPGKVGNGFVFNGYNGNGISVGNSTNLQRQNLTIEAWIKRSSASAITYDSLYHSAMIFGYGSGGYGFALYNGGNLLFGRTDYGGVISSASIADTNWHHVAVAQQTNLVTFYIDGVALPSYTYQDSYSFGSSAGIGCRPDILANGFLGTIDEVAVYNRALAGSEIKALYDVGAIGKGLPSGPAIVTQPLASTKALGASVTFSVVASGSTPMVYQWSKDGQQIPGATSNIFNIAQVTSANAGNYSVFVSNAYGAVTSSIASLNVTLPEGVPVPSGLVSWWRGENNAKDEVGGNNGTLIGTVTYGSGKVGSGFVLNGYNGSGVNVGNPANLQLQNLTIESWIKRGSTTAISHDPLYHSAMIFGYGSGGYGFALDGIGSLLFGKTDYGGVVTDVAIRDTNWHHVAVSQQGSQIVFYLDGVALAPYTYQDTYFFESAAGIGSREDILYNVFLGTIDEVSVYNRVLTSQEIKSIYDAGSLGKSVGGAAPTITAQPASQTNMVGTSASFYVVATGSGGLNYQWRKDGVNIPGATSTNLTISSVSTNDAGAYSVYVTNASGSTLSSNVYLTVLNPEIPTCTPAPAGLVGWWRGENSTLDQISGNSGTITGTVSYGAGQVGKGFVFGGYNGSGIDVGNPASLQIQNLTIEAWIKRSSSSAIGYDSLYHTAMIFGYGDGGYGLGFIYNGNLVYGKTDFGGVVSSQAVSDTNWHHVAVSQQGSMVTFYIDGTAVDQQSYQDPYFFTSEAGIGCRPDIFANGFLGTIDEVSVYNRALSESEISDIYTAGANGKCEAPSSPVIVSQPQNQTNLVGGSVTFSVEVTGTAPFAFQWKKFNVNIPGATNDSLTLSNLSTNDTGAYMVSVTNSYGSVTSRSAVLQVWPVSNTNGVPAPSGLVGWWRGENNTVDEVGGNNGTINGRVTYGAGEVGRGFVLNGYDGSGINVGNSTALQLQNLTIEAWIKRSSSTAISYDPLYHSAMILGYGSGGYGFALDGSGSLLFGKTDYGGVVTSTVVTDTNWHHVAVSQQGSVITFYLDGALLATYYYSDPYFFSSSLGIGCRPDILANVFLGSIDEVALYNRVLSSNEIKAIYDAGTLGKSVAPTAPKIYGQPISQGAAIGSSVTFSVVAAGTGPLSYQWYFNSNTVVGATNTALTIGSVSNQNAGVYRVIVANGIGTVTSSNAVLTLGVPPAITVQPQSQVALAGSNVTLTVTATGSGPLAYQWQRNGQNMLAATNSTLLITNLQQAYTGNYRVIVTNAFGSITSTNVSISILTSTLQIGSVTAPGGATITVPIRLIATGVENAAGFSLQYNTSLLRFVDAEAGDASATLIINTNLITFGEVGFAIALPAGTAFTSGSHDVVYATFVVSPLTTSQSTTIGFVSSPITGKLVDAQANQIGVTYLQGVIQITPAEFEGDVLPVGGDKKLDIADWVKIGRFVAGLDTVSSPLEFQKVDCAPRSTLGNGLISVTDWVQAGRYAAGLDPVTPVGGPTAPVSSLRSHATSALASRNVAFAVLPQDRSTSSIKVQLSAQGDENALAFSVNFDPAVLQFQAANAGVAGARLIVNTNQAAKGQLGLAMALPAGSTFGVGLQNLVKLDFNTVSFGTNITHVTMVDGPVQRELSDVNAQPLAIENASAVIQPLPVLSIVQTATNITVSWPASAQGCVLQIRESLASEWVAVPETPVITDSSASVTLPVSSEKKFFRLERQ